MGLSTNVLWHQTDFDGLKAILTNKSFACSYSLETISWKSSETKLAFPMISFCDIPFADMHEYLTNNDGTVTGKYGKYTIGMKLDWGKRHRLSPVWYRDKNSTTLRSQKDIFLTKKSFSSDEEIFLWYTIASTKNHEGKLKKYGFNSYRFYDEREIRYIPEYNLLLKKGYDPFLSEKEYEEYKNGHRGHSLIYDIQIPFTVDDIAYIFVSCANRRNSIKELLGKDKLSNVVILSYGQILQDIIGIRHNRQL